MSDTDDNISFLEFGDPPTRIAPDLIDDAPPIELDLPLEPDAGDTAAMPFAFGSDDTTDVVEASVEPAIESASPAADFADIVQNSAANAATVGIGSMASGGMSGVGFTSREGYIQALRNGVPAHTHAGYLTTLRAQYGMTTGDIKALALPGPIVPVDLPVGPGIVHTFDGPGIFDRPASERKFIVGKPVAEGQDEAPRLAMSSKELIAGADLEGSHAIVAWGGTSGTTRGQLLAALERIGRSSWAPRAPSARSQAGKAIATLNRSGLVVRSARKAEMADLASGEHLWTVGTVSHAGAIGTEFGSVAVKFRLVGEALTAEGNTSIADPIIAQFAGAMAAELMSDVTGWLSRTLRTHLDAVAFGAMGWLVPARNVAAATALCEAVQATGFGSGWVTGLPVTTCGQLRDGIVRGLLGEVSELMGRMADERQKAADEAEARGAIGPEKIAARAKAMKGDIGEKRANSYLRELRAIGARVVAYGQVLGERRVQSAQHAIRDAIIELESLLGGDHTGIGARFDAVWEEIELDRKRNGGVL